MSAHHVTLLLLLCPCTAWQHQHSKANQDTLITDRYAAVLHDMGTTNGGAVTVLAESKLSDLTSSIQGVFPVSAASDTNTQPSVGFLGKTAPVAVNVSQVDADYQVWMGRKPAAEQPPAAPSAKPVTISSANQSAISKPSTVVTPAPQAVQVQTNNTSDVVNNATAGTAADSVTRDQSTASSDANHTDDGHATENKTKVIEEAVVSLPMASFALDDDKPVQNTTNSTKKEFPGNATEKAAWDNKEKILEKQVEILKAQLKNVSETIKTKPTESPKEAVQVDLHPPSKVVVVAQAQSNSQVQESKDKNLTMSSAFTAPPSKKIASALQSDVNVERAALATDEDSTSQESSPFVVGGIFKWLYSWFTTPAKMEVTDVLRLKFPKAAVPPPPPPPHHAGLLWVKQDSARTARMAKEESQHNIEVKDAWQQLEQTDEVEEETTHREDVAERLRAETAELPHQPSKTELRGRHGAQMSGFWSKLADEDVSIEQKVQSDDLYTAAKITDAQNGEVAQASDELSRQSHVEHATLKQNSDGRLSIHEPWQAREENDQVIEKKIHDSPDLQMIQLRHQHSHK